MGEWQTIDSAPKDGRGIMLAEPHETGDWCVASGRWVQPYINAPYWGDNLTDDLLMDNPTHWQPLPEPPCPSL